MNETLEKIMIFINENTNILIGICLFLIFVLVAYLIDNSIKSRKARKEFKKAKEKDELNLENNMNNSSLIEENTSNNLNNNLFEDVISTPDVNISLNDSEDETNIDMPDDNAFEESLINDNRNDSSNSPNNLDEVVDAIDLVNIESKNIDLSKDQMNSKVDILYKNDKKLSEILFSDINKKEQSEIANFSEISKDNLEENIFDDKKIVSENTEPKNVDSKVEIELNDNELDNIMKKLKNLSSIDEDDSYTNIF